VAPNIFFSERNCHSSGTVADQDQKQSGDGTRSTGSTPLTTPVTAASVSTRAARARAEGGSGRWLFGHKWGTSVAAQLSGPALQLFSFLTRGDRRSVQPRGTALAGVDRANYFRNYGIQTAAEELRLSGRVISKSSFNPTIS
jgi:hypothetical protein